MLAGQEWHAQAQLSHDIYGRTELLQEGGIGVKGRCAGNKGEGRTELGFYQWNSESIL